MKQLNFKLVFMILFWASCSKKTSDYLTVNLDKAISVTNCDTKSLSDISSEYHLIPLETNDSCLLSSVRIKEVAENDIWIIDNNKVYRFDRKTGKLLFMLDRKGQGPEEYLSISDFSVDFRLKILFIYDLQKQKILKYDFTGIFLGAVENSFTGSFGLMDDGFVVCYSPFSDVPFHIGIYDKDWNVVRQLIRRNMEINNRKGLVNFDAFDKFNNQYFVKPVFADTVYKITGESAEPYLIVSKGNLNPPIDIQTTVSKENKQKIHQYISHEYGRIVSKYYFSQYYYQMKIYQDIWDLSTSSLIYRNLRTAPESKSGVSFILKAGKTIYVEPEFVSGNYLYGLVPAEEVQDIVPNVRDDDNPFIIEIKIN